MCHLRKIIIIIIIVFVTVFITLKTYGEKSLLLSRSEEGWITLEPGLELGVFEAPQPSESGDSLVRVLRIDPKRFEFRLLNASAPDQNRLRTAKEWCQQNNLVAATNASMYQTDYRTSVSLMQTKTHVNNPRLSRDKAILGFDRQSQEIPLIKMIDRQCENFDDWKDKYGTFVQSIRMISCKGRNVWSQQPQKRSTTAIGVDQDGNGMFIHVRSPYSTHDLINILLKLPLRLARAMYAEGGRQAQLYIHSGAQEFEFIGSSGFNENDENDYAWPIPNVIGIVRRKEPIE